MMDFKDELDALDRGEYSPDPDGWRQYFAASLRNGTQNASQSATHCLRTGTQNATRDTRAVAEIVRNAQRRAVLMLAAFLLFIFIIRWMLN
jgi:hypothetical protein